MKETTNYNLEFSDNNLKLIKQIIKTAEKNQNESRIFINDISVEDYLLSFNTSNYNKLSEYLSSIQYQYLADSFQVLPFVRGSQVELTDPKGKIFNSYIAANIYHEKLKEKVFRFEIGKWYKTNDELFCITRIENNKIYGYGWNYMENWSNYQDNCWADINDMGIFIQEATDEEVKERLLKYAKENYPDGTKFKSAAQPDNRIIIISKNWEEELNKIGIVIFNQEMLVYCNGKWAEIIEKPLFKDKNNKYWYKSDFKEGDIYHFYITRNDETYNLILKFEKFENDGYMVGYLVDEEDKEFKHSGLNDSVFNTIRKATQEEIEWFKRCEKVGKYVEKEQQLPKSWNEYIKDVDIELLAGYQDFKENTGKTLFKLLTLRDIYRNGWKPDWENEEKMKYVITLQDNIWKKADVYNWNEIFSFQSEGIRDEFYNNFKEMLEKIKHLFQ